MAYPHVYVIHSGKPVADLRKLLEPYGKIPYMGIIYKSFDVDGRRTGKTETNKTIVFCDEITMKRFVADFPSYERRVADYNWDTFPMPNEGRGETWALHISGVPNDFTVSDAEGFVIGSLKCILPQQTRLDSGEIVSNFTVDFAPRSRETGEIYGFGHVYFSDHVDRNVVKMCKLILHNTPLTFKSYPEQRRMVTCIWFRPPTPVDRERVSFARPSEHDGASRPVHRTSRVSGLVRYRPVQSSTSAATDTRVDVSSLSTVVSGRTAEPSKQS